MLSDDVINIFGAARYIRSVADQGAAVPMSELDRMTREAYIKARRKKISADPQYAQLSQTQKEALVQSYAASLPPRGQGLVLQRLPGLDLTAYAGHSANWPQSNIVALGSEYTSKAWDGGWHQAWGQFVAEAKKDVDASGVFP
jgi:hypothetical protein